MKKHKFPGQLRGVNKKALKPTKVVFDEFTPPKRSLFGSTPQGPENAAFCKEYGCVQLCFSKALGDHVCGKNGGQEIGKVHHKQCAYGKIWNALNILTGKNKTFIGIDPARDDGSDAVHFVPMSHYNGTVIKSDKGILNLTTPPA